MKKIYERINVTTEIFELIKSRAKSLNLTPNDLLELIFEKTSDDWLWLEEEKKLQIELNKKNNSRKYLLVSTDCKEDIQMLETKGVEEYEKEVFESNAPQLWIMRALKRESCKLPRFQKDISNTELNNKAKDQWLTDLQYEEGIAKEKEKISGGD